MNNTSSWVASVLFFLAPLLFSGNMVAARWINSLLPPVTLAFGRWFLASLILLPVIFSRLHQLDPVLRQRGRDIVLLIILGGILSVAPQYGAAHFTNAGHIALIFSLSPIMVSVINRLIWKTALPPLFFVGALVAFLGIALVVFEGNISNIMRLHFNKGDIIALIASTAWAGYTAFLRQHPLQLPPLVMLWLLATGSALGMLPIIPVEWYLNGAIPSLTGPLIGGIFFLALVAGIAAYGVYSHLIVLRGAEGASASMYLVPVYAFILGAVVLHESLHAYHLAATLLVLGGVMLTTLKPAGQKCPDKKESLK